MPAKHAFIEVGRTFYFWTVIGEPVKKATSNSWHYPVVCVCGSTSLIPVGSLVRGVSTMCHNCAVKVKSKPRLSPEKVLLNAVVTDYKKSSKRRGLNFSLEDEDFLNLIFQDCFYCGRKPSNSQTDRGGRELPQYNGLDRVNNAIGYQRDNVVTCCRWCNEAKRAKTTEEFLGWVAGLCSNFERTQSSIFR